MKLFIDTSNHEKIIVKLDDKVFESVARNGASQKLLPLIQESLESLELDFSDISEIEVVTSGKSFTGLRVGVSVANTLGWVLDIPVNNQKSPIAPQY